MEEKFKLLDEYNLALKDDEMNKRNMLRQEWQDFCVMLDRAQVTIQKAYNVMVFILGTVSGPVEETR